MQLICDNHGNTTHSPLPLHNFLLLLRKQVKSHTVVGNEHVSAPSSSWRTEDNQTGKTDSLQEYYAGQCRLCQVYQTYVTFHKLALLPPSDNSSLYRKNHNFFLIMGFLAVAVGIKSATYLAISSDTWGICYKISYNHIPLPQLVAGPLVILFMKNSLFKNHINFKRVDILVTYI